MRISTSFMYQQLSERMSRSSSELAELQGQIASGLKYNKPSDAPDIVGRALAIESRIKGFKSDENSISQARQGVDAQATALESGQNLFVRLTELSIQGASGQYTQSERSAMADEVHSIKLALVTLANSRDADGRYVFGGTSSAAAPYSVNGEGTVTYSGGSTPLRVKVSESGFEDTTIAGPTAWQGVTRNNSKVDLFVVVNDLETSLKSGAVANVRNAIDEIGVITDHISGAMARIGASQNRLSAAENQAKELTERARLVLSEIKDLDYASALSDLKKQEVLVQASQALMGRLSQISLLDYLR